MTEVGVEKGVVGGGVTKVQAHRNARGGENRDTQTNSDVDRYGNPLTDTAPNHAVATAGNVTTTATKKLDAVPANRTRTALALGVSAGSDVYFFFGAGTGKTALDCIGPFSAGTVWEPGPGIPQTEVWAVTAEGTATVHPYELLTVSGVDP